MPAREELEGLEIFGFFDSPTQTEPAFEPGLYVPCPVCLRFLYLEPRTTISLLLPGDNRSYFFRAHKRCWDNTNAGERQRIEGSLIDSRALLAQKEG